MKIQSLILFILLFLLYGCVQIDYAEPIGGASAQIWATSNAEDTHNIHVREYSSENCVEDNYQTIGLIKSKMIGTAWEPYLQKKIRAENNFSISILATTHNLDGCWIACQPLVTFIPKENMYYDIEHIYATDKKTCSIDIYESDRPHNQGKRNKIDVISSCNKTPQLKGIQPVWCEGF